MHFGGYSIKCMTGALGCTFNRVLLKAYHLFGEGFLERSWKIILIIWKGRGMEKVIFSSDSLLDDFTHFGRIWRE